jgi:hypothetical protein
MSTVYVDALRIVKSGEFAVTDLLRAPPATATLASLGIAPSGDPGQVCSRYARAMRTSLADMIDTELAGTGRPGVSQAAEGFDGARAAALSERLRGTSDEFHFATGEDGVTRFAWGPSGPQQDLRLDPRPDGSPPTPFTSPYVMY